MRSLIKYSTAVVTALVLAAQTSSAVDLLSLGSATFTIEGYVGSGPTPTQDPSGITFNGAYSATDTVYGSNSTQNWSVYSSGYDFNIRMALTGTNPNMSFSLDIWNAGFSNIINTYSGSTAGLSVTPSLAVLTLATAGTGDFSSVGGLQFTWSDPSTVNTTMTEVVAIAVVPEPSTYALLAMSGLAFGGYVIRRRRRD